ncbi:uncharacterized mitochondrial protein-like protein [Tanacetum coccineum]
MAARGQNQGKGKNKLAYAPKLKIPPPPKREDPAKDSICHECGETGHWKRNCPQYLAELLKKKKNTASGAGGSVKVFPDTFQQPQSNKLCKGDLDKCWRCSLSKGSDGHYTQLLTLRVVSKSSFHPLNNQLRTSSQHKDSCYVPEWSALITAQFREGSWRRSRTNAFLDNKNLTIEKKNLLIINECLIAECLEKDICSIVLTSDIVVPPSSNCLCEDLRSACDREHTKVLELEAEISKQKQLITESEKLFHSQTEYINLQLKFQNYKQCIDTSSASNAIFEINKLRQQLQGKDDTIRNLDAQINIMKVLNVGSTEGSCDQQALETDRIQLKDTITSLRIQLDGLKVENYGPSTAETPKVLAPGMYNLGVKPTFGASKTVLRESPSGSEFLPVVQIVLKWYLDSWLLKTLTGDRAQAYKLSRKVLGDSEIGNDEYALSLAMTMADVMTQIRFSKNVKYSSGSAQFLGHRLVTGHPKSQKSTGHLHYKLKYIALSGSCAQIPLDAPYQRGALPHYSPLLGVIKSHLETSEEQQDESDHSE